MWWPCEHIVNVFFSSIFIFTGHKTKTNKYNVTMYICSYMTIINKSDANHKMSNVISYVSYLALNSSSYAC